MKKEEVNSPEVMETAAVEKAAEVKVKKEKTPKKIKKLAARTAQLLTYVQNNQDEKNAAELIFEGVFKIFGGYDEIPNYSSVLEMTTKYQEKPEAAEKILAPISPEKKAIRKQKRLERLAKRNQQ